MNPRLPGLIIFIALFTWACGNASNSNIADDSSANAKENGTSVSNGADDSKVEHKESAEAFAKTVGMYGVEFLVESANTAAGNKVKITPKGLEIAESFENEIDGIVTDAEVGDLNIDQAPEIYVYVASENEKGKFTKLIAYSANGKKSMSMINLPEIASDSEEAKGFRGQDEFAVVESTLVRRFPVFKEGDPDDKPSGGTRQIQYKLKPGEAMWQLVPDKVVNF